MALSQRSIGRSLRTYTARISRNILPRSEESEEDEPFFSDIRKGYRRLTKFRIQQEEQKYSKKLFGKIQCAIVVSGDLKLLEWTLSRWLYCRWWDVLFTAGDYGHLHIITQLSRFPLAKRNKVSWIEAAAQSGHLHVLQWGLNEKLFSQLLHIEWSDADPSSLHWLIDQREYLATMGFKKSWEKVIELAVSNATQYFMADLMGVFHERGMLDSPISVRLILEGRAPIGCTAILQRLAYIKNIPVVWKDTLSDLENYLGTDPLWEETKTALLEFGMKEQ